MTQLQEESLNSGLLIYTILQYQKYSISNGKKRWSLNFFLLPNTTAKNNQSVNTNEQIEKQCYKKYSNLTEVRKDWSWINTWRCKLDSGSFCKEGEARSPEFSLASRSLNHNNPKSSPLCSFILTFPVVIQHHSCQEHLLEIIISILTVFDCWSHFACCCNIVKLRSMVGCL